jgi:hypothetical protein
MKVKHLISCMLVASVPFLMSGCKKKDNDDDSATPSSGFTAKIDGVSWTAIDTLVMADVSGGDITINGFSLAGRAIDFTLVGTSTGTYQLNGLSGNNGTYTDELGTTYSTGLLVDGGKINISKLDNSTHKMSGTFNFTAVSASTGDTVVITSGSFNNITFTGGTSGGANALSCKVDGVDFIGTSFNVTDNVLAFQAIEIDATTSAGPYPAMHIIIPDTQGPGTYDMAATANDGYYWPTSAGSVMEQAGTLVITVHNTTTNHIEGTFNFTAQNISGTGPVYTITNGTFVANY